MGRITIFALTTCPHCKAAKALITNNGWEYYEVNLSDYPEKRPDMLALCDRLTVPQIFFGTKHLGGASEVKSLNESGELAKLYDAMKSEPDPTDPRMQKPDYPPKPEVLASKRTEEAICIGDQDCVDYVSLITKLRSGLDIQDRKAGLVTTVKRSFTGKECVDFLIKEFKLRSRAEGVQVGNALLSSRLFHHVDWKSAFLDSQEALYRLEADEEPLVLNRFRSWNDRVDPPLIVVKNLKKKLSAVQSKYTDSEGMVDYMAMPSDPEWPLFQEASCELQKIDLYGMSTDLKIAFVINLYNLTVIFAFAEFGIPQTNWTRLGFFDTVKIDVGGELWSLNELESGILRSNRSAPYHISKPLKADDARMKAVLQEPERRIHFALNCGAKSCPPVKNFTEEAIQEELRVVAMAFCEMEENVKITANADGSAVLSLSKIFEWYRADFNGGGIEAAKIVVDWLRGERQEKLRKALDAGKLKVKSLTYDWTTNAKRSLKYDGTRPKAPSTDAAGSAKPKNGSAPTKSGACCVIA
mmetsp:Transcript_9224/g.20586  ORF Transcript_9224/g.20586 Transcript_9224/m.20586 type:complete len:526 (+) Transcript_9224:89-1666(+)